METHNIPPTGLIPLKLEILEIVRAHLLAQDAKSEIDDPRSELVGEATPCAYRGEHGRKCAIGILMPDENYSYRLEGQAVNTPTVILALPEKYQKWQLFALYTELQRIHDKIMVYHWPEALTILENRIKNQEI